MDDKDKTTEEIFKSLLTPSKGDKWKDMVEFRRINKGWLDKSTKIAIQLLSFLDEKGITKKEFGETLGYSYVKVNKILSGRSNLTLKTISEIEKAFNIKLI